MDLTRLAIEKNRVTAVALLVLFAGGIAAYQGLPRAEDPGFTIRFAQVTTLFPGAGPERVESLITDRIEDVAGEISEVEYVSSTSVTGASFVLVKVRDEFDELDPIWTDLRRKVERVAPGLPAGVIGPTVNDEFGDVFQIVVTLTGEGFSYAELKEVADHARDELLRVPEVAKVEIHGAQEERVFVDYDNARLNGLGLSPLQLRSILESANVTIPGGDVRAGPERIPLEPTGAFTSVEDLRRTAVALPGRGEIVFLEDLVDIHRGTVDPPSSLAYASGSPALVLAVSMGDGGNVVRLGDAVAADLSRLQALYPIGIELDVVAFQPEIVDAKVRDFLSNLVQAVVVVLGVMFLFLGLRTSLVVASLVPVTMVVSLLVMSVLDVGIDQMSLAALIMALGMLVDNAIVMAESIMVRMEEGSPAVDAAVASARELRYPLLVSSLTTSAGFLPIFLAESTTGEYTAPLFKVITTALLVSWLLALTMTPLLCVVFLRVKRAAREESFAGLLYVGYRRALRTALRHRLASLGAVGAVFAAALAGFGFIPSLFFPGSGEATFTARYALPAATSIARTTEVVEAMDGFIASELRADGVRSRVGPGALVPAREPDASGGRSEGVTNWVTYVGTGGPRFRLSQSPGAEGPSNAYSLINATDPAVITGELIPRIQGFAHERFPDLEVTLGRLQSGPGVTAPVGVRVSGADTDTLFGFVDSIRTKLHSLSGVSSVTDDWGARRKKLVVVVDQPRARRAGVSNQDVAVSLQTALRGFETTEYREGEHIVPVTLRSSLANRAELTKLDSLNVYSQATGASVPLRQVADIRLDWEPGVILRRDGLKTVTVSAYLEPGWTAAEVVAELGPWLAAEQAGWPIGYRAELGGEAEASGAANRSITEKLPIAALIILLLLVVQFNSARRTAIILSTIPLGLIGVSAGLLVMQSYFGFMTLLGIISLAGIIINNGIVLLERIRIEEDENGLEPHQAILTAAERRLRPILLTTATTVGGLIPLWLGGGAMWEPLAIAMIFGLPFGTVLTLVVVPVLYSLFFRVRVA